MLRLLETKSDASVPKKYLGAFLGHKVWTRPEAKGGSEPGFHELVDVWLEDTGDAYPRVIMWALVDGEAQRCIAAKTVLVQGVDNDQVRPVMIDTRFGPREWQELRTNFPAPDMVFYPKGYLPDRPEKVFEPEVPLPPKPEALGDQFLLPI